MKIQLVKVDTRDRYIGLKEGDVYKATVDYDGWVIIDAPMQKEYALMPSQVKILEYDA